MSVHPEIIRRYDTFWAHKETDRPIICVAVPDKKAAWAEHRLRNVRGMWDNPEARYACLRFTIDHTQYFGEAMPYDWLNFGPGCMAAMMGSDYLLADSTVWFGEGGAFLRDWSKKDSLRLLEDSPMLKLVDDTTRLLAQRNDGSYIVGITDLGGNLDILASLRGTQTLLTDLYDDPQMVVEAVERIDELWKVYYTKLRGILRDSGQLGHTTWLGPWCETTYYPLQCDFAAMLSPDHFAKFVMPSLTRISEFLDHSVYHLDGPGQIAHLDHLLSLPRLDGIQWVPGDGNMPVWDEKWFPLYERILSAGKALIFNELQTAQNVRKICRTFPHKDLWISVTLDSEQEAKSLLEAL